LYSHNTFIFLQNTTLGDFRSLILDERFACIRSVHLHWQFRENGYNRSQAHWQEDVFSMMLWQLNSHQLPRLDHLSIFIQGPLNRKTTYEQVIREVRDLYASYSSSPPNLFVLRLPHPNLFHNELDMHSDGIDEMLGDPSIPFQVIRPTQPSQGVLADTDVGVDVGWRCGVMFLPSKAASGESADFVTRSYIVWTPLPPGVDWPFMF
jgi:hypothetical protein